MSSRRPVNSDVIRLMDSMILNRAKYVSGICAFLGTIVLCFGIYVFVNRILFLARAASYAAPVVAISHEWVPAGRGSVMAYVPTVPIPDREGRPLNVKVDASNEQPIYSIGQQMLVSCNLARGCIEDTFWAKWHASIIDFLIALLFFSPLLAWKFGLWQPDATPTTLNLQRDV